MVEFLDNGSDRVGMTNTINRKSGTVEFFVYSTLVGRDYSVCIFICDGSRSDGVSLYISSQHFVYYDGIFRQVYGADPFEWYHVKIKFDVGFGGDETNDWHLWIDGDSLDRGNGYQYRGNPSEMDTV